jgi:thermitase
VRLFGRFFLLPTLLVVLSVGQPFALAQSAFPNDPYFKAQWYLQNTGQGGGKPGADIHAVQAWGITRCSSKMIIAVLDTGIDATHPDLAGKVLPGASFVPGVTSTSDDNGHGTMVAGVAAPATDNGQGIAGVCPNGKLLDVKVADAQGHTGDPTGDLQVAQGIRYAVQHGARVLNLSLGTPDSQFMRDAVDYAWKHNAVIVAATPGGDNWPSDYPHVIAVDGTDESDNPVNNTTHGAPNLVLAPDKDIFTTARGGSYALFCTCESVAAPIVSGIAALILSIRPDLVTDQVIKAIERGADTVPLQEQFNSVQGWGRVNAYRSLQYARTLPVYKLAVGLGSATVRPKASQSVTVNSRPNATVAIHVLYANKKTRDSQGKIDAAGHFTYSWRVAASRGSTVVTVTVSCGQGMLAHSARFAIR